MAPFRRTTFPTPVASLAVPLPVDNAGSAPQPNVGFFEFDAPLSADERAWLDADVRTVGERA